MAKKLKSKGYQDLGLLIDVTGIADEALSWSNKIYNLQHVKQIICHCLSTQAYELYVRKSNEDGVLDWGNAIATGLGATGAAYAGITIDTTTSILGYAVEFGMKNKSGAAAANFELYVQALS